MKRWRLFHLVARQWNSTPPDGRYWRSLLDEAREHERLRQTEEAW